MSGGLVVVLSGRFSNYKHDKVNLSLAKKLVSSDLSEIAYRQAAVGGTHSH